MMFASIYVRVSDRHQADKELPIAGLIEAIDPRKVQRVAMWDGDRLSRDADLTGYLRYLI